MACDSVLLKSVSVDGLSKFSVNGECKRVNLGLGNFRDAESVAFSADSKSIFVTVERRHAPLLRIDINGALPE